MTLICCYVDPVERRVWLSADRTIWEDAEGEHTPLPGPAEKIQAIGAGDAAILVAGTGNYDSTEAFYESLSIVVGADQRLKEKMSIDAELSLAAQVREAIGMMIKRGYADKDNDRMPALRAKFIVAGRGQALVVHSSSRYPWLIPPATPYAIGWGATYALGAAVGLRDFGSVVLDIAEIFAVMHKTAARFTHPLQGEYDVNSVAFDAK